LGVLDEGGEVPVLSVLGGGGELPALGVLGGGGGDDGCFVGIVDGGGDVSAVTATAKKFNQ
jgi:hypothetical protein